MGDKPQFSTIPPSLRPFEGPFSISQDKLEAVQEALLRPPEISPELLDKFQSLTAPLQGLGISTDRLDANGYLKPEAQAEAGDRIKKELTDYLTGDAMKHLSANSEVYR